MSDTIRASICQSTFHICAVVRDPARLGRFGFSPAQVASDSRLLAAARRAGA